MKIAIRGDGHTGIEILNILEKLDGEGSGKFFGNGTYYYYIDDHNYIQHDKGIRPNYIYYESLEDYLNPKNQTINYSDI